MLKSKHVRKLYWSCGGFGDYRIELSSQTEQIELPNDVELEIFLPKDATLKWKSPSSSQMFWDWLASLTANVIARAIPIGVGVAVALWSVWVIGLVARHFNLVSF